MFGNKNSLLPTNRQIYTEFSGYNRQIYTEIGGLGINKGHSILIMLYFE